MFQFSKLLSPGAALGHVSGGGGGGIRGLRLTNS